VTSARPAPSVESGGDATHNDEARAAERPAVQAREVAVAGQCQDAELLIHERAIASLDCGWRSLEGVGHRAFAGRRSRPRPDCQRARTTRTSVQHVRRTDRRRTTYAGAHRNVRILSVMRLVPSVISGRSMSVAMVRLPSARRVAIAKSLDTTVKAIAHDGYLLDSLALCAVAAVVHSVKLRS
jgi:hypothetical protein